jgi:hypothetical protein
MRQAQKGLRRTQVSRTLSVSAPVAGWNARDPLAEMGSTDAVILNNLFCTPYDVVLRNGYSNWATGMQSNVNSLTSYSPPSGSLRMFAYAGANIYDVTNPGPVGAPVISGALNDKWQHVNYGTAGGNFLVGVNGNDLPIVYNGTGWSNAFAATFNTAVTSITSVGTTATVTMAAPHNMKTGMSVIVAGFTPTSYNGTYKITVTGLSTFTYVLSAALGVTTVTGTVSPFQNFTITGVDPTLFINCAIFKSRLWFVEKNSMRVWYMPTLSIGGVASPIDLSSLFNRGGYLMAMGDWSLDAGYGMDDYAVFISSEGQVAVYKGTDPSTVANWSLVGVYEIGSPVGRRCLMKYAGDLTLICQDGLSPLSKSLMSSRINTVEMMTDKIQNAIGEYITSYGSNFGWETHIFPKQNMLLLNVPTSSGTSYQLVMNTISGAWSQFIGWNAACFELHGDQLYFGSNGVVCKAWDTQADNGTNINFEAQQSFNYFGQSSQLKQLKMLRPIISTDGNPSLLLGVNVDFDTSAPTGIPSFSPNPTSQAIWDSSVWDSAVWVGGLVIKKDWQTCFALGYCLSAHLLGSGLNIHFRWAATDYLVADGGVL